jgi:hypothetical protein
MIGGTGEFRVCLYTVVLEYVGGTYVSQVRAADVGAAVRRWAGDLARGGIDGLPREIGRELAGEMAEAEPVPLSGLVGAWCCTGSVGGRLGLVNIICTAEGEQVAEPHS